jgi:hypothetical protein
MMILGFTFIGGLLRRRQVQGQVRTARRDSVLSAR